VRVCASRYQPPPPYITVTDPYVPFAIVAAELSVEKLIVLGQVADGFGIDDVSNAPDGTVAVPMPALVGWGRKPA